MISPRRKSILAKRRSLAKRRLLASRRISTLRPRIIFSGARKAHDDNYYKRLADNFMREMINYGEPWMEDGSWEEWCFEYGRYPRYLAEFLKYNDKYGEEEYDENDWQESSPKFEHFRYDYDDWCGNGDVFYEFIDSIEKDVCRDIKELIESANPTTYSGYERDIIEFLKDNGIRIASERGPARYRGKR